MTDQGEAQPPAGEVAARNVEATGTLALLNQQADVLRTELARLRQNLADVQREFTAERATQLREANEKLVLAALHAESIADAALRSLSELARSTQRDTLTDTPNRALMLDRVESAIALARRSPDASGDRNVQPSTIDVLAPSAPSKEAALAEQSPEIQDLREANEQLVLAVLTAQELEEQAEDKHRRQVKFIAMVAHELRNPLNPIRTAAELLKSVRGDEALLARLQSIIESQVVHMAQLVDDLLEGSRATTGRFRLECSTIDMIHVLHQAVETCRSGIAARRQNLALQFAHGSLEAHGDPVRLAQIFSNLLDNASKYTPEGGEIKLALTTEVQSVVITVSDNGIGVTPEALPHIFELFVQDERALGLHNGGLGIGLAVVRDLVEAHGGTVLARSAGKGLGSEFVVRLPILGRTG